MGHMLDRCDFLDVLEESAVTGRSVAVTLKSGHRFVDQVRDVVTEDGEDWAVFRAHQQIALGDISDCVRAQPREGGYAGKAG